MLLLEIGVLVYFLYQLKNTIQESFALDRFGPILEIRDRFIDHLSELHQDPSVGQEAFFALLPVADVIDREFKKLRPSYFDCLECPGEKIRRILRQEFKVLTAAQ